MMNKTFEEQMAEAFAEQEKRAAIEQAERHKAFLAAVAEVDSKMRRYLPYQRCKPLG